MRRRTKPSFRASSAEESTGFLLWQVTTLWQRDIRAALKGLDLTHVQFVLLASLAWLERDGEPTSQVRLARHAKLDVTMTSQVLRTLEKKNLVVRGVHPRDPRAKVIALTPVGRALATKAVPAVDEADGRFFSSSSRDGAEINGILVDLIRLNAEPEG